jgi:biopolymer transport protein ExbD
MKTEEDNQPSLGLLQTAAFHPIIVVFFAIFQWCYLDRIAGNVTERAITFELPSVPEHSRILSPDTLSIDIRADGTVSIAGVLSEPSDSSDLPLLRQHLRSARHAVNKHGGLVVRPDSDVQFQRLIDVLSAVAGSGILYYGLT